VLWVVPCKHKLRVGCLTETQSARELSFCPGHVDRLVKVLDRLLNLALLKEELTEGCNGNIALGIGYLLESHSGKRLVIHSLGIMPFYAKPRGKSERVS